MLLSSTWHTSGKSNGYVTGDGSDDFNVTRRSTVIGNACLV